MAHGAQRDDHACEKDGMAQQARRRPGAGVGAGVDDGRPAVRIARRALRVRGGSVQQHRQPHQHHDSDDNDDGYNNNIAAAPRG